MTITLNSINNNFSSYNFKANKNASSEQPVQAPVQSHSAEAPVKKEKKSLWKGFKNAVAGVQKFFIKTGEYAKGALKGLFWGGAAAASIRAGSAIVNKVRDLKLFGEVMNKRAILKAPMKASPKAKLIAGAVGVGILGVNLFKSYLNSNEKGANVDHRWNTGHKDK